MAHELAGAFQQALRIGNLGAQKKPDIDVSREGIYIGECRITDTRGRLVIVQQLSNIVSAVAHDLEPALRDRGQFIRLLAPPGFDRRISPHRTRKPHQSAHITACSRRRPGTPERSSRTAPSRSGTLNARCARAPAFARSEERRVGKECRCRWWP